MGAFFKKWLIAKLISNAQPCKKAMRRKRAHDLVSLKR